MNSGMQSERGPNKRNDAQKAADVAQIAEWRLTGNTLAEIKSKFDALGRPYTLSQTQIYQDWKKCFALWRKENAALVTDHIDKELASMQKTEAEAWRAWEKSKEAAVQKRLERMSEGGEGERNRHVVQTEEQCGDPRYLDIIAGVRRDRIKLMGLDAAQKIELSGSVCLTKEVLAEIEKAAGLL